MKKIVVFLGFFIFARLSAQEDPKWIFAAQKFSYTQIHEKSKSEEEFALTVPKLILNFLPGKLSRNIPPDEEKARKLYELQSERISLFLQLSKEIKTRDGFALSEINFRSLKRKIDEQEKKIDEVKKKIEENLEKTKKIENNEIFSEEKSQKKIFARIFSENDTKIQEKSSAEKISLYQNNSESLFSPSQKAQDEGEKSRIFEKEVVNAKINALLCGKITKYGDYASVSIEILQYPGGKTLGGTTEVGFFSDPIGICERISEFVAPILANAAPFDLKIVIKPEEATKIARLTIDDVFYNEIPQKIRLDSGIHNLNIEANGFVAQNFSYNFSGAKNFEVIFALEEENPKTVKIRLKKFCDGFFYANGTDFGKNENQSAKITVNGKSILGIFTARDTNETAFFYIPPKKLSDKSVVTMKIKPYDRKSNIDKRRRWMYTAYTCFICSMPFMFYSYGMLNGEIEAYNLSEQIPRIPYENLEKWQKISLCAEGISIGFGAWFLVELVRYLIAANDVLPEPVASVESE